MSKGEGGGVKVQCSAGRDGVYRIRVELYTIQGE